MELPIPSHLEGILEPVDDDNDESEVYGELKCHCGGKIFSVSYVGEVAKKKGRVEYIVPVEISGEPVLAVKARCRECGREYILFDSSRHGWDGFVSHSRDVYLADDQFQQASFCKCGKNGFSVNLDISNCGKDEFVEETKGKFNPGDWVNAFDYIGISLRCSGCGDEFEDVVDMETCETAD